MDVKVLYVAEETFLIVRQFGLSTYVKQLAYAKWLSAQPFGSLAERVIVDLRGLTETTLTTQEIYWQAKRIERVASELGLKRKIAFVISTDLGFGMARIYQGFCAGGDVIEIDPFYSNEEALSWLNAQASIAEYDARDGWLEAHFEDPSIV
jgi:hypothetical protein